MKRRRQRMSSNGMVDDRKTPFGGSPVDLPLDAEASKIERTSVRRLDKD
jgi:hypothetical protein